jgi:hypothetical protein
MPPLPEAPSPRQHLKSEGPVEPDDLDAAAFEDSDEARLERRYGGEGP